MKRIREGPLIFFELILRKHRLENVVVIEIKIEDEIGRGGSR